MSESFPRKHKLFFLSMLDLKFRLAKKTFLQAKSALQKILFALVKLFAIIWWIFFGTHFSRGVNALQPICAFLGLQPPIRPISYLGLSHENMYLVFHILPPICTRKRMFHVSLRSIQYRFAVHFGTLCRCRDYE